MFAPLKGNAFSGTFKFLSAPAHSSENSIFTQAVLDNWKQKNFDEPGFQFTQILEPSVLAEIAILEGLNLSDLEDLTLSPDAAPIRSLRWLFDQLPTCSPWQKINLASFLITLSRFKLAESVLNSLDRASLARQRELGFEAAFLRYIISNRRYNGLYSEPAFAEMRRCITEAPIHPLRVMRAASQAVVWHVKTGEVSAETCAWFVDVCEGRFVKRAPPSNLSDWYRAKAMLPARQGKSVETRELMRMAEEQARMALAEGDKNGPQNFKTVLESRLKEELYVRGDAGTAVATGLLLTSHDPNWPSAWAELGEAHLKNGQMEEAKLAYEKAVAIGAPYFLYHLYTLASVMIQMGDHDGGLDRLRYILAADPSNVSAAVSGAGISKKVGHPLAGFFMTEVERLDASQSLSVRHKRWIEEESYERV